ncbi:hypothetical protein ABZZ74_30825 [Streptomyces sp. NPDC006476]|uniref:hypothetical protein n=1 Tax=Streptomyces sp. NPDC006476 TaxID=3157175 RepID=UPI0033AE6F21
MAAKVEDAVHFGAELGIGAAFQVLTACHDTPLGFQDQPSSAVGAATESTAAQAQGRFQLLHPDADDRWLWLHGTLPSARERIAAALGVPQDIENVAAIVRRNSKADEIERRLVDGRCVAPASRTPQEWLASPAGAAVDAEPLAHIIDHPRNGSAWRPTPRRPLAGLRVRDLTQVFAAPTSTRFVAALGAEVPDAVITCGVGTRWWEGWSRTVPTMPTSRYTPTAKPLTRRNTEFRLEY